MELRPVGFVDLARSIHGRGQAGTSVSLQRTDSRSFESVSGVGESVQNTRNAAAKQKELERKDTQYDTRQTEKKLPIGKRDIEFKLAEGVNMYQLHVIDRSDGSVVRKIPSDEALRMIAHLKEKMQAALKAGELREQLDVFA